MSQREIDEIPDYMKPLRRLGKSFCTYLLRVQLGYPADDDGMNGSNTLGCWKLKARVPDFFM